MPRSWKVRGTYMQVAVVALSYCELWAREREGNLKVAIERTSKFKRAEVAVWWRGVSLLGFRLSAQKVH